MLNGLSGSKGFTCIPMMAYMKNNIAISKQTYGSALKDWTKVQSSILIVYPWRSSLINRAARKSLKKPTLNEFSCCFWDKMVLKFIQWFARTTIDTKHFNLLQVQEQGRR